VGLKDNRNIRFLSADFNPTLNQMGELVEYNLDRYISLGILD
jgi:hypothetical protein